MAQRRSSKLRSIGIGAAIAVGASLGVLAPPALAAPANGLGGAASRGAIVHFRVPAPQRHRHAAG